MENENIWILKLKREEIFFLNIKGNQLKILHVTGGSKVASKSENTINIVAKLLGVEAAGLKMALTTRLMSQVKQLGALGTGDIK